MKLSVCLFKAAVLTIALASCKKTRTCECTNSNGSYTAGEVYGTKKKATQSCQDLTTAHTKCNLKN